MSFYGSQFVFDDISCSNYDLMIYDIESANEDGKLASSEIIEDRTAFRHSPLHYGITQNSPLKFSLTFGVDINRIDKYRHLDRFEMEEIASWLTGHEEYKYLEIIQPDMNLIRYKCIITDLEYISYGKVPWAFKCQVNCDSSFAYMLPTKKICSVNGQYSTTIHSYASCKYYYPRLKIKINNGNSFSIVNHSDNDREFLFYGLPASPIEIMVDNENEIITNSKQLNLYDCFNFKFFRLTRGCNKLELNGDAEIEIMCEFPVNTGS